MQMDCLIAMPIIHRYEIMTEDTSSLRTVFQCHTYIIIIFNPCQSIFCFRIMQKTIMISLNKDNLAIQTFNQLRCFVTTRFSYHVPKHINQIPFSYFCIPSANHLCIHFFYGRKWTSIKLNYLLMSKMIIACKKDLSHFFPFLLSLSSQVSCCRKRYFPFP